MIRLLRYSLMTLMTPIRRIDREQIGFSLGFHSFLTGSVEFLLGPDVISGGGIGFLDRFNAMNARASSNVHFSFREFGKEKKKNEREGIIMCDKFFLFLNKSNR